MVPEKIAEQLRAETDKSRRLQMLAEYFSESYQWVVMRNGSIEWRWDLPPFPRELALIALDRAD